MKALTICSALLLAVPTAAAPVPKGAQSANLIVNGRFEEVKDDDAAKPQDKGPLPSPAGWRPAGRSMSSGRSGTSLPVGPYPAIGRPEAAPRQLVGSDHVGFRANVGRDLPQVWWSPS